MRNLVLALVSVGALACSSDGRLTSNTTNPDDPTLPGGPTSPGVASVVISPKNFTVHMGKSRQLTATAYDAGGNALTDVTVSWSSSDTSVAQITSTGVVTGKGRGKSSIHANAGGKSDSTSATVDPMPVASLDITPIDPSLSVGSTAQFAAVVRDSDGVELTDRPVTWTSSNPGAATVSSSGLVTAVAAGKTIISGTSEGITDTTTATITSTSTSPATVTSVSAVLASPNLIAGQTTQATATVKDSAGNVLFGRTITWSSSNTAVATVNASGVVTAVAAGTAQIIATCEGKTGSATLTVTAPVASVSVSLNASSLVVGQTTQATATLKDASGNTLTGRTITWSSSNTAVATVNASGVVSAVGAGTVQISATSEGKTGSASLTVSLVPVATVSVSLNASSLTVGQTTQATATLKDASGNTLTGRTITWSSSNGAVATVNASGVVTAVTAGTAQITATSEGKSGSAGLTVAAPPPSGSVGCSNPQTGWIWCDDFEADHTSSYFEYVSDNNSFVRTASVGRNGSSGMRAHWAAGQVSAGSLKLAFGKTPDPYFRAVDGGTANYRDLYWRVYVRNQAGWTGGGGDKLGRTVVFAKSDWSEAAIGHTWAGSSPNQNYLVIDPASGTDAAGTLQTVGYNDFAHLRWLGAAQSTTPIFDAAHVGQWYCVETHMKLNTPGLSDGVLELRINGTLEAQRTGLNWVGSYQTYGINALLLENYWNAGSPQAQERYFDDLVVSTQPIGCDGTSGGGTTAAPVATVGVSLNASSLTVGQTTQATATLKDASGNTLTGRTITWSSSNTAVATVNASGVVTAVGGGTAQIRATSEGITGSASLSVTTTTQPPPTGTPAPGSNAQILLDLRQSLQNASTIDQAFSLFGVVDHTPYRGARNTYGWSFTTNYDGQGTHALRADWEAYSTGDQGIRVIDYLPSPTTDLYVQWKGRVGKHPADPDANGTDNSYATWPQSNSCKRALFERGSDQHRVDYTLSRNDPEVAKLEMGAENYAFYSDPNVWNFNSTVGGAPYTTTVHVRAASSTSTADGIFQLWINGTLVIDKRDVPAGSEAFNRWEFPATCVNVPQAQSEYFWDILVWKP